MRARPLPRACLVLLVVGLTASVSAEEAAGQSTESLTYEEHIRPIFERRCVECHGISKKSARLRLDSFELAMEGNRKGAVIRAGNSAESRLVERITSDDEDERMPPEGDPLAPAEIALIRSWIDAGAAQGTPVEKDPSKREVSLQRLPGGLAPAVAVAGAPDGTLLAVARGARVIVYRLDGGKPSGIAAILREHRAVVQCLAFSDDGKYLASGGFRQALVWTTRGDAAPAWSVVQRLAPHTDRVLAVAFSHDGTLIATAGGMPSLSGELKLWETATGKLVREFPELHSDAIYAVAFSPDSKQLATSSADRMVHVTEIDSGKRLARFEGHTNYVLSLAYSPDGKRLVTAGADNVLKSWDLEKKTKLKDWTGHGKPVTSVAYSPDGKFAASVSGDHTLRMWNADGKQLRAFGEARDYLYGVSVFAGGKLVAATGADGTVRVYDAQANKLVASIEPLPSSRGEEREF